MSTATTLSYSLVDAVAATGLSRTFLEEAIARGELKVKRSSINERTGKPQGKRLILAAELQRYLDALPEG